MLGIIMATMLLLSPVKVDDVNAITDDAIDVWVETSFGDGIYVIEINTYAQTIEWC